MNELAEKLETAHEWMLTYEKVHHISNDIKNMDWFEIMAILAECRMLLTKT